MLYLSACRVSEALTKVSPSEVLKHKTDSYGTDLRVGVVHYLENGEDEPALLLEMRNSHRKEIAYRTVALPLNPKYDPWVKDLAKYILDNKKQASFNITRQTAWAIVKRNIGSLIKKHAVKRRCNPLRHWRLTHLVDYYGFDPYRDLVGFAGWTFKGAHGGAGQLDTYLHLNWRGYFPKLLKPPPKI